MKKYKNWVCFRKIKKKDRDGKERITKAPFMPNGKYAKSGSPQTWSAFEEAAAAKGFDGIGFMFSGTPYVGIDIDSCVDDNGQISPLASELVSLFKSYTEYSPSGRGLHIIAEGGLKAKNTRGRKNSGLGLEIYDGLRYFTITGDLHPMCGNKIRAAQNEIDTVYSKYFEKGSKKASQSETDAPVSFGKSLLTDEEVLRLAAGSKNGAEFSALYSGNKDKFNGDWSAADMALCGMLAFWCRCDYDQMDRIFRTSGLMRPKWDEKRGADTYAGITIKKAAESCKQVFNPSCAAEDDFKGIGGADENGFNTEKGKIKLKGLDYEAFAKYLIEKYALAKIDGHLHRYADGLYTCLSDSEFDGIIINEVYNSKARDRAEFKKYAECFSEEKEQSPGGYILFKNGVLDTQEGKFLKPSPEFVFCSRIPHRYNPTAAKHTAAAEFLSDLVCGDKEAEKLLKQVIGYCFYRNNFLQKFLLIKGRGGNGKSTFADFLSFLVGYDNVSFLTLEELKENFSLPQLRNKLLNFGDDIEDEYVEKVAVLKKMVTGEPFQAGGKYKDKKPMRFYGKTIFTANKIPKMNDKTNGLKRRMIILPFLNDFTQKRDGNILDKLKTEEAAEYVISVCVGELMGLLKTKAFTIPKMSVSALHEWETKNNPIVEFIEEYEKEILTKETQDIYRTHYMIFCSQCGYKPLGRNGFYEAMAEQGYIRVRDQNAEGRPYIFTHET